MSLHLLWFFRYDSMVLTGSASLEALAKYLCCQPGWAPKAITNLLSPATQASSFRSTSY